jgi:hypothetical protein
MLRCGRFGRLALPLASVSCWLLFAPAALALSTMYVGVQPIQVCTDDGSSCANESLERFQAEMDKIWGQADLSIQFLPWLTVHDSDQYNENSFSHLGSNADDEIINMWFVNTLAHSGGGLLYGMGSSSRGVTAVTKYVFSYNSGNGRRDTMAHEIGHVLGLLHSTYGAGASSNVMTAGSSRSVPDGVGNITPDGSALSELTALQVTRVRSSDWALTVNPVPEPGTAILVAFGLLMVGVRRKP